jgi:hypothetical protein
MEMGEMSLDSMVGGTLAKIVSRLLQLLKLRDGAGEAGP